MAMDAHKRLMDTYYERKLKLENILRLILEHKKRANPKELANELAKRGNDI